MNQAKPTGAFFGRRKGHPLRQRQAALMDTLLPRLKLDLAAPAPADLRALFHAVDEVRLESGFGGGEHLIAEASQHPRAGFIGIEPFVNGMAKALAAIDERKLQNIRLHHGDATDMLAWLPDASLVRFDLLYPDPWPKRRPDFTWTAEQADDWRQPWPGFSGTRYEAKAKREGRVPCYLIFKRK